MALRVAKALGRAHALPRRSLQRRPRSSAAPPSGALVGGEDVPLPSFRAPHLPELQRHPLGGSSISRPAKLDAYVQEHENDPGAMAIVHYPGTEMVLGSFHPMGALYNEAVSISRARQAVLDLVSTLSANKVKVVSVGEILCIGTELDDRVKLERLAMGSISYTTSNSTETLTAEEASYISNSYKEKAVKRMDTFDLIDAIVTRPTLTLEKSQLNTPLTTTAYNFSPLTNLVFTRDQQIVTAAGVVLSQLHSQQRAAEVKLIRFCLERLGIPILGQVPPPGKLEGGDFLPAGKELCFIGLGIRTNARAIQHMLHNKWFGTDRVAVVKDLLDRNQARMHLDCVFNIVGDDLVVLVDSVAGEHTGVFRLVDEYTMIDGSYQLTRENVEFSKYLTEMGFNILRLSDRMYDNYGCNFINCGNSRLITTDAETADFIARSPHFKGSISNIDYGEVTKMFGALHCSTQVWRHRRPDRQRSLPPMDGALTLVTHVESARTAALPPVRQTTNWVLIVAPTYFAQNSETFQDNSFMQASAVRTKTSLEIIAQACQCFARLHQALVSNGVHVKLYHHEAYHGTPDAVFPNNWFSTHSDNGTLVLYPMKHPSRRRERRSSILTFLKAQYPNVLDLTEHERDQDPEATAALEGTGALVLDRVNKVAFCALSQRATEAVLTEFCGRMGYRAVTFETAKNIYHTNVMMSIGTTFAVVCLESIAPHHRAKVVAELKACRKTIIPASERQMDAFLCNCLELCNDAGEKLLFMSRQAHQSLSECQMYDLLQHVDKIVDVEFDGIESVAGGGVRCALAELF